MADTLNDLFGGMVQVKMQYSRVDSQEFGTVTNKKNETTAYNLSDGSGDDAADIVYADTRTVSANAIDTIDLTALTQHTLGVTVPFSFARVKVFRIVNKSEEQDFYLYFGASETDPSNSFAIAVGPSSEALLMNPKTGYLVNSTNNELRTYNPNGSAIDFDLYIIGSTT